jgi:hypothetical protein
VIIEEEYEIKDNLDFWNFGKDGTLNPIAMERCGRLSQILLYKTEIRKK